MIHPEQEILSTDPHKEFEAYSAKSVLRLDSMGRIQVDSICDLQHPTPELVYIIPLVLNTYIEIVTKPTKPHLVQISDTMQIELRGYKQFKNRGIRLTKLLKKKLGNRYSVSIASNETTHTLQIIYTGKPWEIDQLMSLPIIEASQKYELDPALLMSLIRHVSNFNFDFKGPKDSRGLLALNEKEYCDESEPTGESADEPCNLNGLNQVFAGARHLSKQLKVLGTENAIATFYPERGMDYPDASWTKSPLIKSWVDQVLEDVEFYRNNGI